MIKRKVVNGYTSVVVCYDRALREMPYAQCGVNVYKDGRIDFISYATRVITIDADGWLEITGTYCRYGCYKAIRVRKTFLHLDNKGSARIPARNDRSVSG